MTAEFTVIKHKSQFPFLMSLRRLQRGFSQDFRQTRCRKSFEWKCSFLEETLDVCQVSTENDSRYLECSSYATTFPKLCRDPLLGLAQQVYTRRKNYVTSKKKRAGTQLARDKPGLPPFPKPTDHRAYNVLQSATHFDNWKRSAVSRLPSNTSSARITEKLQPMPFCTDIWTFACF